LADLSTSVAAVVLPVLDPADLFQAALMTLVKALAAGSQLSPNRAVW
jgi:hypothetical protein